jgi:hypothetical protein
MEPDSAPSAIVSPHKATNEAGFGAIGHRLSAQGHERGRIRRHLPSSRRKPSAIQWTAGRP